MEQKNQQNTVFDSLSYENDIYTNNYFIDPFTNTKIMVEIFFKDYFICKQKISD